MKKENDITSLIIRSLSGAAGPDEEQALQGWLREAESHRQEYEQARRLWAAAAEVDYSIDPRTEAEWGRLAARLGSAAASGGAQLRRLQFWRYAAAAIVILGLAGIAGLYFGGGLGRGPAIAARYEALPGQTRQLALADGSAVHLNAGSTLSVIKGFGQGERRLILDGEAFFQVSHNPQQAFVVEVDGAEVRVTGTAFNLRAYPESEAVQLAVSEGSVAFSSEKGKARRPVQAGQAARLDRTSGQLAEMPFDRRAMAWQEGVVVFENTPFPEAIQTLERQFAVDIRDNTGLQNERYTASFDKRSLDDILAVMGATMGFQVEKQGESVVLK